MTSSCQTLVFEYTKVCNKLDCVYYINKISTIIFFSKSKTKAIGMMSMEMEAWCCLWKERGTEISMLKVQLSKIHLRTPLRLFKFTRTIFTFNTGYSKRKKLTNFHIIVFILFFILFNNSFFVCSPTWQRSLLVFT